MARVTHAAQQATATVCRCGVSISRLSRSQAILPGLNRLQRHSVAPTRPQRKQALVVENRVNDPDSPDALGASEIPLPNPLWRAFAALMYLIPWMDIVGLGRWVHTIFPWTVVLYYIPAPLLSIYFSSQWTPLIVFFLIFLAVVKNTKLHHFIRFNSMQAIMLDICSMLFIILKMYLPADLRWTWIGVTFQSVCYWAGVCTILYCIYFTLRGKYAEVPYVSDAVYTQLDMAEMM